MDLELRNIDTNNKIIFDDRTFILNNFSSDDTTVTHNANQTIKQIGEYVTSSSVSSRQINIIGYIIGASEEDLKINKNKLLNLINPLQNVEIIANHNRKINAKPLSVVQWGAKWENNNNIFCKFSISFLAPNTLWNSLESKIVNFSPYDNGFIFPISIPQSGMIFGHKTLSKYTTVFNESNVSLGCKFTLTTLSEAVNPSITNMTTGKKMILNITLQLGDVLVITTDFNKKNITLNGKKDIKVFDFLNSDWLMLESGINTFTYNTENDSNLNIQLEYFENYWGVV